MNSTATHQEAVDELTVLSKAKGFITFDDILETSERHGVSICEMDKLSELLQLYGVIIYERKPPDLFSDENLEDDGTTNRNQVDYDAIYSEIGHLEPSLEPLMNYIRQTPTPQFREVQNLILQAQDGNEYARTRIIEMHLRIAMKIALNFSKTLHTDLADAIFSGILGLINALDKFDANGAYFFSQYAPFWIQQFIVRDAPSLNQDMYFPVHVKETLATIYDLYLEHDCHMCAAGIICPNLRRDVSLKLNVTDAQAEVLIGYLHTSESIDAQIEENEEVFSDRGMFECEMLEQIDINSLTDTVQKALRTLTPKEADVICLRFGLNGNREQTLEEVGQRYNLTRERIRQIESKAIRKLRSPCYSKVWRSYY